MTLSILSLLLSIIFFILAGIHFNWAWGGNWGFEEALPSKENGELVLNPRPIDSFLVGIGLTAFGLFYLLRPQWINFQLPNTLENYAGWIIPTIFILRAIGDFKYVGVFKKIKTTKFAQADSKLFSPLCLGIGAIGLLLQLLIG